MQELQGPIDRFSVVACRGQPAMRIVLIALLLLIAASVRPFDRALRKTRIPTRLVRIVVPFPPGSARHPGAAPVRSIGAEMECAGHH